MQQQLERCEKEKADLKQNLDKVTQEGKTRHAELDKKAQSLAADLLTAQQDKENQKKELLSVQENLGKANKTLKDFQIQLETERKNHKAAVDEKVRIRVVSAAGNMASFYNNKQCAVLVHRRRLVKRPNRILLRLMRRSPRHWRK